MIADLYSDMDRENADQQKLTLNFIDIIVSPLYKKLHKLLPGPLLGKKMEGIQFTDQTLAWQTLQKIELTGPLQMINQ